MLIKSIAFAAVLALPAIAIAAPPAPKISNEVATRTAVAAVPHGIVKSSELETEHGRLIYSYDIAVTGKSGVEEVQVDAMTGRIVSRKHEGPLKERAESIVDQGEQAPK